MIALVPLLILLPQHAPAPSPPLWTIGRSYRSEQLPSDGSTGSSNGDDGVELDYDLPVDAPAQERGREWRFPARVFRSANGGRDC